MPATDSAIARKFGSDTLEHKSQNKTALQEELGWAPEPRRPMICIPTGVTEKLGGELLKEIMAGLLSLPVEIVILGKGSAAYGTYLSDVAQEHNHRVAVCHRNRIANDRRRASGAGRGIRRWDRHRRRW